MSFRDLGIIELTVFAVLTAAFLLFFILYVILRHRKRAANSRKLLRKQAMMEEAVQKKVRRVGEKPERIAMASDYDTAMMPEEYGDFAPPERDKVQEMPGRAVQGAYAAEFAEETDFDGQEVRGVYSAQAHSGNEPDAYQQENFTDGENVYRPKDTVRERNTYRQESLRMWDSNSKSMRIAKRSQQEAPLFIEERRISHRRDQLKRLEESK